MDQLAFLISLRPSHRARYFALLVINRVMAVFEQYLSPFTVKPKNVCLLVIELNVVQSNSVLTHRVSRFSFFACCTLSC